MPVRPIAAVLRWFRRTAARLGLAERLAAAAAPQEPEPLLQLRRRQVVSCSTSAAEKETQ
jgi:membrane carboxypeptidase/penicillin-binding protein PbpC